MGNMTPEECFTGKKPEVSHFRIFGSLTYSHVPSEKRTKLEPTAKKGIFVGYDETWKAFRIYLPSQRKVVVRREVKFEEERAFRKFRLSKQGEQQVLHLRQLHRYHQYNIQDHRFSGLLDHTV